MIANIDWQRVFKTQYPAGGATDQILSEALTALFTPLSADELASIARSQTNPFPTGDSLHSLYRRFDAASWQLPTKPLPPSYMAFLRWSDGGSFFNDSRHFDPFLTCHELRQYLIHYHIPQYMPNTLPFALSGCGEVYMFDMRCDSKSGEYPILFASLGSLRFEQSTEVGRSFFDVCSGNTHPQE